MKKAKYIILSLSILIYIATLISKSLSFDFVQILVKGISLFIIIAILLYTITTSVTTYTIKYFHLTGLKETVVHTLKIVVFLGLLILSSFIQLAAIQYNDYPHVGGAYVYDNYGHLIYISKYKSERLHIYLNTQTDSNIQFDVSEEFNSTLSSFAFSGDDDTVYDNVTFYQPVFISTTIEYDELHRITKSTVQTTIIMNIDAVTRTKSTYESSVVITTNDFTNGFEQTIQNSIVSYTSDSLNEYDLTHADLTDAVYDETRYYQTDISENEYTISKEYTVDNELVTELYITVSEENTKDVIIQDDSDDLDYSKYTKTEINRNIDEIIVTDEIVMENSNSDHIIKYHEYLDYGYLITKYDAHVDEVYGERYNTMNYSFIKTLSNNNNYYLREFDSDSSLSSLIDDEYYQIRKTEYGFIVETLDFNDEMYFKYLLHKDLYDSENNGSFLGFYNTRSLFNLNDTESFGGWNDLFYLEPLYLQ